MARGKGRISLRLYGSVVVAFFIPLVIITFLFIYLEKVNTFRYFFSGYGKDIDIIEAIAIDRQYNAWQNMLNNFLINQTLPALEAFNRADEQWQKRIELLESKATQAPWQQALGKSAESRRRVMTTVDNIAQNSLVYTDYIDSRIMPQHQRVETAFDGLIDTLYSQEENETGDFARTILETYRQSLITALHYATAPTDKLLSEARASFIQLEDGLSQISADNNQAVSDKVAATRRALSEFYTLVENFSQVRNDFNKTKSLLDEEGFQAALAGVNPMAATDWKLSFELAQTRELDSHFKVMNYLLLIGFLILVVGLIYGVIFVRANFDHPMNALISYVSHAYVTRRRSPVPGMERNDDIGLLARSLHAMIERLQLLSEQQRGFVKDPDEAITQAVGTMPHEARDVTVIEDRAILEPFLQLQDKTNEFNRALVKIGEHAHKASDQSSKTAELADHTRKTIQDTALAMQDLLQAIATIHKASEVQNAAVGLIDKHRSSGDIKIRSLQLSIYRMVDTVKALQKLCDQANLISYNAQIMERNGSPPSQSLRRIIEDLSQFSNTLREALSYVDNETISMKSNIQETVKSLYNLNIACKRDAEVSRDIYDKTAAYKEAVMNQYSQVQNAAFQAGRLSLLLLDVSSDIVESSNVTSNLKYLASDMMYLAEQLKDLAVNAEGS
jgi:methyl-accepting chemotaxis protein